MDIPSNDPYENERKFFFLTLTKEVRKKMYDRNNNILDVICNRYGFETYEMIDEFLERDKKALKYVLYVLFVEVEDLIKRKLSEEFEKFVKEHADEYGISEINYDE